MVKSLAGHAGSLGLCGERCGHVTRSRPLVCSAGNLQGAKLPRPDDFSRAAVLSICLLLGLALL